MFFDYWVMSDSLQPHGLQHTRLPCPSLSPGVCSNSSPLSWWGHPTISSSVTSFSFYPQSFPAAGSFPKSQFFTSGGQSIGVSASASVLPMYIQGWCPLRLTGLISLQSKGLSRVFSSTTIWKHWFFGTQHSLLSSAPIHECWKMIENLIELNLSVIQCFMSASNLYHVWKVVRREVSKIRLKRIFAVLCGLRNLSSLIRDENWAPCSGCRVLTTGPPGKSLTCIVYFNLKLWT